MTPGLVERHQTYVMGPNQDSRLTSVAAGATIEGVQLKLDSDAPFVLRRRAMRVSYDASRRQTGLNHLLLRWADADSNFTSQDFIRQSLLAPYFGQLGNPIPVYKQVTYPRNGFIRCDIRNDSASALSNVTMYWQGVKLFAPGAVKAATYPARFGLLPFNYPQIINSLAVTQTTPLRQTFVNSLGKPISDADFVMRSFQAGLPFSTTPVYEVFIKFLDEDEKPYSNDAVHVDVFGGNSGMPATYPCGTNAGVAPIGCGPASPGLFYPEIYVPKNHIMYYELTRADVAYAGAVAVNFRIALGGVKVFNK